MEMQSVVGTMNLCRLPATDRDTVKIRNEFRGVFRGCPLREVLDINADDIVRFEITLKARDFRLNAVGCLRVGPLRSGAARSHSQKRHQDKDSNLGLSR